MSITNQNGKMLVHLHLFYHDQLAYMLGKLGNITGIDYDLVVTVIETNEISEKKIRKFKPDAQIIQVPNKGYDVGPFVHVINQIDLAKYDYVLKIHTKNQRRGMRLERIHLHSIQCKGFAWRDALIDALIGEKKIFLQNLETLRTCPKTGMLGNKTLLLPTNAITNAAAREYLCRRLNIENQSYAYIAGTMFIVRAALLQPVKELQLNWKDFDMSLKTGDSGGIAHALEDVFAQLVWKQGFSVDGVEVKSKLKRLNPDRDRVLKKKIIKLLFFPITVVFQPDKIRVKICSVQLLKISTGNPEEFIIYFCGLRIGKYVPQHGKSSLQLVQKSKYFNEKWYNATYPEVRDSVLASAEHYLKVGWQKGYNPSKQFDTSEYLRYNVDVAFAKMNPLVHYEAHGRREGRKIHQHGFAGFWSRTLIKLACNLKILSRNKIILTDAPGDTFGLPLDNFAFFEYLQALPNSIFDTYYILNKQNPAYLEIKKKYKKAIISYQSSNKWFFAIWAWHLLKTRFVLDSYDALSAMIGSLLARSKYVENIFTQHGITFFKQSYITPTMYGCEHLNKTTVSNDYEYDIFKKRGGFVPENIIKSGLFRWDYIQSSLPSTGNKQVMLYFTYRHYFTPLGRRMEETAYFKNIISLINNRELADLFGHNGVRFKIALHHALLPLVKRYNFSEIDFITEEEIADCKNISSLLITDYSSMCFEFFFQDKPVIFYRLDEKEFRESPLDFKYADNLDELTPLIFNVFNREDAVVQKIKYYAINNFTLEPENSEKAAKFFYHKRNIRQRFYEWLVANRGTKKFSIS